MTRRQRKRRGWRWIYGANNRPVAMIEERDDGWHAVVAGMDVGVFASQKAAEEFIGKIGHGNADGR
jgi:hypothetical protein